MANPSTHHQLALINDSNINLSKAFDEASSITVTSTTESNSDSSECGNSLTSNKANVFVNDHSNPTETNEIVPYAGSTDCQNNQSIIESQNAIIPNVVLPQNNQLVSFTNNNASLNHIIDSFIDYPNTTSAEVAVLKQYLAKDFENNFKIPNETVEQATVRCFKKGMFFYSIPHLHQVVKLFGLVWGFRGSRYGKMICCSRAHTPNSSKKKKIPKKEKLWIHIDKNFFTRRKETTYPINVVVNGEFIVLLSIGPYQK